MRIVLLVILVMTRPTFAAAPEDLIGVWKLVSWQVIVDDQPQQDVFGLHPKGYLVLTPQARTIVPTTAENRRAGRSDAERAELQRSMVTYSGRHRIEGDDFVTRVEMSWNEEWNRTEHDARPPSRLRSTIGKACPDCWCCRCESSAEDRKTTFWRSVFRTR